jgi:hypothetical protein
MVKIWTPETLYDSHGTPYQNNMAHQDDSTEDDMLYVEYDDYKALEDLCRRVIRASHHEQPGVIQAIEDHLATGNTGGES